MPITATGGIVTEIQIGIISYKVHSFIENGTFEVTDGSGTVETLIVAGGGGGGNNRGGGGGGGGWLQKDFDVSVNSYPVLVGSGGAGGYNNSGDNGGNSSFAENTAIGGGGGANYNVVGRDGGSGGGGGHNGTFVGGSGISGQGNDGGVGGDGTNNAGGGGGGGGAGHDAVVDSGGGIGIESSIDGTAKYYAGGGGGGCYTTAGNGAGGLGGGGDGSNDVDGTMPEAGTANTGGGGGGGANTNRAGANGGSGIVIIRYATNMVSMMPFNLGVLLGIGNVISDRYIALSPLEIGFAIDGIPAESVPATAFSMGAGMDIGEISLGVNVSFEPFSLGMSLDFGNVTQNIALSSVETGLALDGSPMQSIPVQPFEIGMSIDLGAVSSFETGSAIIRYFCILTGAADGTTDLTLPMSSFQARRRSGDPTYLSVVIPTVDYATEIAARPNGTLKIQQAYEQNGVIKQTETIMETTLDEVNPDEGGTNRSTTLVGYSTSTYSAKAVTLTGVTYRSTRAGKYHYRLARPYIFLNPGDTVTFLDDGVSFVIDTMIYFINPTTSTIELAST